MWACLMKYHLNVRILLPQTGQEKAFGGNLEQKVGASSPISSSLTFRMALSRMLGLSPWASVFRSVKWGIRMFKKIHEVSNYYGILPRTRCWTKCPFRKTVTPVLAEQIYPWKQVGVFWTAFRGETWPGNSAAFSRPRNCGVYCRVLCRDPSLNYTMISSGDLVYVLFRRQYTALQVQVLHRLGSDGLLNSENSRVIFSLLLPIPLEHSSRGLSGPVGISWGSLKPWTVGVILSAQGHQAKRSL